MTSSAEQVLEQALRLPDQDRNDIILRLLETLDETNDISDEELLVELEDRVKEGFEDAVDWNELRLTR